MLNLWYYRLIRCKLDDDKSDQSLYSLIFHGKEPHDTNEKVIYLVRLK